MSDDFAGGYRHATDRVAGTAIAECPNIDEDPEEHLSITVEYEDAADADLLGDLLGAFPECGECGAELEALSQEEPVEVLK